MPRGTPRVVAFSPPLTDFGDAVDGWMSRDGEELSPWLPLPCAGERARLSSGPLSPSRERGRLSVRAQERSRIAASGSGSRSPGGGGDRRARRPPVGKRPGPPSTEATLRRPHRLGRCPMALAAKIVSGSIRSSGLRVTRPNGRVERGQQEQVQQRRGDQPAQDHDGHRVLDLVPGLVARDDQRHQRQPRRQAPSSGSAPAAPPTPRRTSSRAERLALLLLQVAVVADQHDAVAGRDAQHGHEPDQRPQRQHAAAEHARRPRRRSGRTAGSATTSAVSRDDWKSTWRMQQDAQQRQRRQGAAAAGCDSCRAAYSPRNSGWYSRLERHAPAPSASISRATAPRSRPCDVAGDVDAGARPSRA